jgi:hypothetical protein
MYMGFKNIRTLKRHSYFCFASFNENKCMDNGEHCGMEPLSEYEIMLYFALYPSKQYSTVGLISS